MAFKVIATNKKAYHNYHLSQNWECGIALTGVRDGAAAVARLKEQVETLRCG